MDDDADFLELEKSIFESQGYEVSCFSDPRSALAALGAGPRRARRVLVVCDLMMRAWTPVLVCPRRQDRPPIQCHSCHHRLSRLEPEGF